MWRRYLRCELETKFSYKHRVQCVCVVRRAYSENSALFARLIIEHDRARFGKMDYSSEAAQLRDGEDGEWSDALLLERLVGSS